MVSASFMDPSKLQLGSGGSASGGFDPDQFNAQSFSFFNPSAFTSGGKKRFSCMYLIMIYMYAFR